MILADWMEENEMSIADVADEVGLRYSTVYRYVKYGLMPSADNQRSIYLLTQGEVTPNDWLGLGCSDEEI